MEFTDKLLQLEKEFDGTGNGLQEIINAYKREGDSSHPETIVWYQNGTVSSYNIVGDLEQNLISDRENIVKVEIGNMVTRIRGFVFELCSILSSVMIPNTVTQIGSYAFYGCSSLESISIPDSVTTIETDAFAGCSKLTSVVIPFGVTSIEDYTFRSCSELTSITIPAGVTIIKEYAFDRCLKLASITSLRNTAPTVQTNAFGDSSSNYAGRNSYSAGTNVLRIPQGATGYDAGAWLDPLQDSNKCGFHVEYI